MRIRAIRTVLMTNQHMKLTVVFEMAMDTQRHVIQHDVQAVVTVDRGPLSCPSAAAALAEVIAGLPANLADFVMPGMVIVRLPGTGPSAIPAADSRTVTAIRGMLASPHRVACHAHQYPITFTMFSSGELAVPIG